MGTLLNNVIDQIKQHRPIDINNEYEWTVRAKFEHTRDAQNAYFDVIKFDDIDAACVDSRLTVWLP